MPGPGKKPNKLKVIAGTERKDRMQHDVVELPLTGDIPDAPDWLPNSHAKKEWDRLAPTLHAVGLLTEAGLSALAHLCSLHGKLVQLWSAGESPNGNMMAQYRSLANDFGLTPVAQGKVKASAESKQGGNQFASNGKRSNGA